MKTVHRRTKEKGLRKAFWIPKLEEHSSREAWFETKRPIQIIQRSSHWGPPCFIWKSR